MKRSVVTTRYQRPVGRLDPRTWSSPEARNVGISIVGTGGVVIRRPQRRTELLGIRRPHAQIGSDDVRLRQPLPAEVAGEHQRAVQERLQGWIVRHGLHTQPHRKFQLDAVTCLPTPLQHEIAARRRRCVEHLAIHLDRRGSLQPSWNSQPDCEFAPPRRGHRQTSALDAGYLVSCRSLKPFSVQSNSEGMNRLTYSPPGRANRYCR